MRLSFECDEPLAVLSRVLDQVRRLGVGLQHLSVTRGRTACAVRIEFHPIDPAIGRTLFNRIVQIGGLSTLRHEHDAALAAQAEAVCHD